MKRSLGHLCFICGAIGLIAGEAFSQSATEVGAYFDDRPHRNDSANRHPTTVWSKSWRLDSAMRIQHAARKKEAVNGEYAAVDGFLKPCARHAFGATIREGERGAKHATSSRDLYLAVLKWRCAKRVDERVVAQPVRRAPAHRLLKQRTGTP